MKVELAEVARIAELAHLQLEPEEAERMRRDLETILGYVRQLNAVDTAGVEAMAHVLGARSAAEASGATLREDVVAESLPAGEALQNAPEARAGLFQVPRIIERS